MKKKEIDFSKFKIFGAIRKGHCNIVLKYPDTPILSIGTTFIVMGNCAINKIRATKNDEIILAEKEESFYIAVSTLCSSMKGYSIRVIRNNELFYVNSKSLVIRGIKLGVYEIKEPVFSNNIDFFELMPFKPF